MGSQQELEAHNEALADQAQQEDLAAPEPYVDEADPQVRGEWRVQNEGDLDFAFARLAHLEQEVATNEELGVRAIARVEERVRQLNAKADRGIKFFRFRIEEFARNNRDRILGGGKKKSRDYPNGRIAWRKRTGGLVVDDDAALLAWAQSQPMELGLVRIKEAPDLKAIQAFARAHNLVPPGMSERDAGEDVAITAIGTELEVSKGE